MIKIIKGSMVITRQKNDIKACSDTHEGIHMKFMDNTEIMFSMTITPELKAIVNTISRIHSDDMIIDFNNSKNPLTING